MTVDQSRVDTGVLALLGRWLLVQVSDLQVGVCAEKELGVLTLLLGELGVTLHRDTDLELAASHPLELALKLVRVATEHLDDFGVLDAVEKLDGAAVVHETRDGAVKGLRTERSPDTCAESVLGSSRLETNAVEGQVIDLALRGVLLALLIVAVELGGLIGENLRVLNKAVPLVRVELLQVLQHGHTRVRLVLANDLAERKQNLLTVVGNEDGERRHVVNRKRLGNRSRQGLCEERDAALGLRVHREELGLKRVIFLGHEEGRRAESTLALLLGGNLVVEQLLHVVDGEQVLTVHGDDDGVPDLGNKDLGLVLDLHVSRGQDLGIDTLGQTRKDVPPGRPDRNTEVERAGHGEHTVPNDVPKVCVQEEQNQISEVHQNQEHGRLVLAENVCLGTEDVVTEAVLDVHAGQDTDRITERESQEEVGLSQLGSEDQDPETVGHPHVVAAQVRPAGGERLGCNVLAASALEVASEESTNGHDREPDDSGEGDEELHNTEHQTRLLGTSLNRFAARTKDVDGRCDVEDEHTEKEEETLGQVLCASPSSGNVHPLAKGGEDHDQTRDGAAKGNCRPVKSRRRLVVKLLLVVSGEQDGRVERGVEPVDGQMDDPNTAEVGKHVEPGAGLLVCLEERLLPDDILQSLVTLRGRQIDQLALIFEGDALDTLGVPEELVHVIVTDNLVVVTLLSDVLALEDLVTLISAVLVQRCDGVVEESELLDRLDAVLASRRVEEVVRALVDEAENLRHVTDLVGLTPAEEVESNLADSVVL